jgi:hypothetical protein
MSTQGFPGSSGAVRGAFVQLIPTLGIVTPSIVAFQYNPETISQTITPYTPPDSDQNSRTASNPMTQPFTPDVTYSFSLELDATDRLEEANPLAVAAGIAPQLASFRKLVEASKGAFGDLIASAQSLVGGAAAAIDRPEVPITLMVLGPGTILPVRITSYSIEMTEFNPALFPVMAKISIELIVVPPEQFRCKTTPGKDIAIAAYNLTALQDDALAVADAVDSAISTIAKLPI